MRNKLWFRLVLFLSAILLLSAAFVAVLNPLFPALYQSTIGQGFEFLYANQYLLYIAAAVFLLLGVVLMISVFSTDNKKNFLISNTEYGEFIISTSAITDMVVNSVNKFEDIKTNKVSVSHKNSDIVIKAAVEISTSSHLPSVVHMLQKAIKEHIEDCTGLSVKDIKVLIKNNNDSSLKVYKSEQLPVANLQASERQENNAAAVQNPPEAYETESPEEGIS